MIILGDGSKPIVTILQGKERSIHQLLLDGYHLAARVLTHRVETILLSIVKLWYVIYDNL